MNILNGKEKGILLILVGNIATKDDFTRIKNITGQDMLVPPPSHGGRGDYPQGAANLGDPASVGLKYARDGVIPACKLIMERVNKQLPAHLQV
ncbi:hypothetical protein [Enterovibrio nigricans]|uniref:Uncharacterized protein n=1 Tax=Enterovibrio nigricans DSM 22720 TaxID=1121868 RepID=A0A1T4VNV6_9GAMM|nr:hypothetical protein [Enterovibrio nigricans]SKA66201.1 hypothetical protein SAMN02745132_04077 [Enterovibrio nigricans DSM 22720]